MIISIILFSICLFLTVTGQIKRMLDRLSISFSFAISFNSVILCLAIMPHIKTAYNVALTLANVALLMLFVIYYILKNKNNINFVAIMRSILILLFAMLVLTCFLTPMILPPFIIELIYCAVTIGISFVLCYSGIDCIVVIVITNILSFLVVFFSPIYVLAQSTTADLLIRQIDVMIYSLFLSIALFDSYKRRRLIN